MPDQPTRTHPPGDLPTPDALAVAPSTAPDDGTRHTLVAGEGSASLLDIAPPPGYVFLAEVGRGGMGVVYRARDQRLNRDVAVKVLQERYPAGSAAARRFQVEARVTGQLQHPGIPPVHEVGTLPDGRPFLAMKLIKGTTLDSLLAAGTAGRGSLLATFEQVCQAVAYSHEHGVVHRDLKPHNVMVGKFGEVQVMDWGLAKFRAQPEDGTAEDDTSTLLDPGQGDGPKTRAGAVMGTPAYMPPEQAIGAVELIDERADVFGLGGVLCAILTGKPPYVGNTPESTRQLAAQGKLGDAFARLDSCGAEPELVALAKRCLAADKVDRPRDAGEVARAVAELRAAADERARRAELDRVRAEGELRAAELKAAEQRKRRKVQLALAGALLVLVTGIGAFAWWQDRQAEQAKRKQAEFDAREAIREAERRTQHAGVEAERRFTRAGVAAALDLSAGLRRQYRFRDAGAAVDQAAQLAARAGADDLRPVVEKARADLAFAGELDEIRMKKYVLAPLPKGKADDYTPVRFDSASAPPAYRTAFLARGLDLVGGKADELVAHISASAVRRELADALDDWAAYELDPLLTARLLEVARRADPGPWLDRFRDPAVRAHRAKLEQLARDVDPSTPPAAVGTLAGLMQLRGADPSAMLLKAQSAHPGEFPLAFGLGMWFAGRSPQQAVGHLRAARTIRPDNPVVLSALAQLLVLSKDDPSAESALRDAVAANAASQEAYQALATYLQARKDADGTVAVWRQAVRANPKVEWAYRGLNTLLIQTSDLDSLVALWRGAVRENPHENWSHSGLSRAVERRVGAEATVAVWREAVKLNPHSLWAYRELTEPSLGTRPGVSAEEAVAVWRQAVEKNPDEEWAYLRLAGALVTVGDRSGAEAVWRGAIKTDPSRRWAHAGLAQHFQHTGEREKAITVWREVIRTDPADRRGYDGLASALGAAGDKDGPVAAWREAVGHNPNAEWAYRELAAAVGQAAGTSAGAQTAVWRDAAAKNPAQWWAHAGLGTAVRAGDPDAALAAWREAARLGPKAARSLSGFGLALGDELRDRGDLDGAVEEFREVIRNTPLDPAADLVPVRQHVAGAYARLGGVLEEKGDAAGAVAAFRSAARLADSGRSATLMLGRGYPGLVQEYGYALWRAGHRDEALGLFRTIVREESFGSGRIDEPLGLFLFEAGDLEGAAKHLGAAVRQKAHGDRLTEAKLRQAERGRELLPRLPDVLAGRASPATSAEACDFARLCGHPSQRRYLAAARLYAAALADPGLPPAAAAEHRGDAALCAVLAAAGRDPAAPPPGVEEWSFLTASAMKWLRADLALWREQARTPDGAAAAARRAAELVAEKDFYPVRHRAWVGAMPQADRAAWAAFWDDVGRLERVARGRGELVALLARHKVDADDPDAVRRLGEALANKGDRLGAAACYRRVAELLPKDPAAHLDLASALGDVLDWDGAAAAAREAIRLDPKDDEAHNELRHALLGKGDLAGSEAACRAAIALAPDEAVYRLYLGDLRLKARDFDGAVAAYDEALRLDGEFDAARTQRALALKEKAAQQARTAPLPREVKR